MHFIGNSNLKLCIILAGLILCSCDAFVTQFENSEEPVYYVASSLNLDIENPVELKVMTWNIRFGAGRLPWFGDSCGERVILSESEVTPTLNKIRDFIQFENPDILLLQEVDVSSKRTGYLDQVQWILDNSSLNYGVYGSMWRADFIPSDGLGKVDVGNVILSKWPIVDAERIQLPLRGDQDKLTQYFYLRRNVLKASILLNNENEIYALCTHTTAFATDDTKKKHLDKFYDILSSLDPNKIFIAGGDLNALSSSYVGTARDFCELDKCIQDQCDGDYANNTIYQGSYFNHLEDEQFLLDSLYKFHSAIDKNLTNMPEHYTHSTWINSEPFIDINQDSLHTIGDNGPYNRKLDYIFSSNLLENGTTHSSVFNLSDHAPVSATVVIP